MYTQRNGGPGRVSVIRRDGKIENHCPADRGNSRENSFHCPRYIFSFESSKHNSLMENKRLRNFMEAPEKGEINYCFLIILLTLQLYYYILRVSNIHLSL